FARSLLVPELVIAHAADLAADLNRMRTFQDGKSVDPLKRVVVRDPRGSSASVAEAYREGRQPVGGRVGREQAIDAERGLHVRLIRVIPGIKIVELIPVKSRIVDDAGRENPCVR